MKITVITRLLVLLPAAAAGVLYPIHTCACTGSEGMTLLWKCDETGASTQVVDASVNGNAGTINGALASVADGISGSALTGFTSAVNTVSFATGQEWPARFTLQLWLRNPGNAAANVIAVGGATNNANRPWQLHVSAPDASGNRTLALVFQSWIGTTQTFASELFKWERDTWYQLALAWSSTQVRYKDKDGKEKVETGVGFKIYLTPAGAEEANFLFGGTTARARCGGKATQLFTIGGASRGYYPGQVAGHFGGDIDEVALWLDKTLTDAQLAKSLKP
ncbi:MAG: LamG domain-containing protein [Opitutaceae bacterium]|jgi:hypothetical protein|nr:LamG domain-containing protein [Opitutaceae bacterium]